MRQLSQGMFGSVLAFGEGAGHVGQVGAGGGAGVGVGLGMR